MRSKTPLVLMEQLVMVLVFALAAAVCLRVFAFSNQMSQRNRDVDRAVLLAQNTAELLKSGGEAGKETYYDENLNPAADRTSACYEVKVLAEDSGVEGLGKATVEVFRCDGNELLFSVTAAWQEVSGNG